MTLLTVADWAASVPISRQAAYQAIERCGIPVSDGKVDAELASHLYALRTRVRAKVSPRPSAPGVPSAQLATSDETLARAQSVGRLVALAVESGAPEAATLDVLRDAMREVPVSHRARLRLSVPVWDALVNDVVSALPADDGASLTDEQLVEEGGLLYLAAIGALRVVG